MCLLFQCLPFLYKLCFSYQFHYLIFSSSALCSLEDLWLGFVDCLLLDLDEYSLIDLTDDVLHRADTSERLELTAAFLSASASFIQLWIFCLNAHRLFPSTSSNHSSSVSCASGYSIDLYSLCTSKIILKMSSSCCVWARTDSKFLKEHNIPSTALDFLIIFLFNLERFFLEFTQMICNPSWSWFDPSSTQLT